MKKTAIFLTFVLLLSFVLPLAAHAQTQPKALMEVLAEKSADEREIFGDTELYDDQMQYEWIDDEVLITTYSIYSFWHLPGETWAQIKAELEHLQTNYANSDYAISDLWTFGYTECLALGDTPRLIRKAEYEKPGKATKISCIYSYVEEKTEQGQAITPPCVRALLEDTSSRQTFCGEEYTILDVVAFIPYFDESDVLCYITDGGVFYRCYDGREPGKMIELSESEMSVRKKQYQDYFSWYSYQDGELKQGREDFIDFMENELWNVELHLKKRYYDYVPPKPNVFKKYLALWIAIPSVLATAGGVTAFLVIRKKKKENPAEE